MVDEIHVQESIQVHEQMEKMLKQGLRKAAIIITIVLAIAYVVVMSAFMIVGETHIHMNVAGFLLLILVVPVLTFFAGLWIAVKKKFYPQDTKE